MGSLLVVVFPSRKKCLGGIFIILIGVLKDPKMKSEKFSLVMVAHAMISYYIPFPVAQQNSEYSISSHTFTFMFDYPTIWKSKVTILYIYVTQCWYCMVAVNEFKYSITVVANS